MFLLPAPSFASISPLALSTPFSPLLVRAPHPRLLWPPRAAATARPAVLSDTLRILEWDKVCDAVASFAGTSLGREATQAQLWEVGLSYLDSKKLLEETNAAVELIKYGVGTDFAGVDTVSVRSAISRVARGLLLDGIEAMAIVCLVRFAETLQMTLKTAVKEDADWYNRFMPLTELILTVPISLSFAKSVQQLIEEDGSVKDSASPELKRSRGQVRAIEKKLHQLMDKLMRSDKNESSSSEVCIINGRCCIKVVGDHFPALDGLFLPSGSGVGNVVEPIACIPLNDELQQARAQVAKAEQNVLSNLTDKMFGELNNIQNLLDTIIKLDAVTARAKYSIAYDGAFPDLYLASHKDRKPVGSLYPSKSAGITSASHVRRQWKLYMPNTYHPLLLQQHRENLDRARKDVASATTEIRRRGIYGKNVTEDVELTSHLEFLKLRVSNLEKDSPIPVDFMVSEKTNVLVITGPNTGGKTISLKTVGLASLMAKTGLFVLASEPVKIPWFDAIYADIGDEQSLTQSLSTFSGHLKQIGVIRSWSTSKSLVLLDEVGAGTNPLEGAALGMSLLASFAESGSFLTIVTTHHGELKTLKYSNNTFENACVEFDDETQKPTYRILWGVPGRSNAINIARKLGLPQSILEHAQKLHGTASAEINEVIVSMERFKQETGQHLQEAQHYLIMSRKLCNSLSMADQNIADHVHALRNRKIKAISESAVIARSILRSKMQQIRESIIAEKASENGKADKSEKSINLKDPRSITFPLDESRKSETDRPIIEKESKKLEAGDVVYVPALQKQATVMKVEASKGEVLVQAGNIKLRIQLEDIRRGGFGA